VTWEDALLFVSRFTKDIVVYFFFFLGVGWLACLSVNCLAIDVLGLDELAGGAIFFTLLLAAPASYALVGRALEIWNLPGLLSAVLILMFLYFGKWGQGGWRML